MTRPAALIEDDWHEAAVAEIERLARTQAEVTAEDLRRHIDPPEHANQIGTAFQSAHRRQIISSIGYRPSTDRSRRGGSLRIWTLHPSQATPERDCES